MTKKERQSRRFSESFRKDQVFKIESGELTIADVSRLYHVRWASVKRWVDKFGTKSSDGVVIQTREEINRIKDLEKRNAHLEKLLGQGQIRIHYLEECVRLAKDQLGADFEKKIKRYY